MNMEIYGGNGYKFEEGSDGELGEPIAVGPIFSPVQTEKSAQDDPETVDTDGSLDPDSPLV